MATQKEIDQAKYELRKDLADAIKVKFEELKATCDKYKLCMICWYPYEGDQCHCNNDS